MKKRTRAVVVDTRTVPEGPDLEITGWLGPDCLEWTDAGLVVRNAEGDPVRANPGWELVRYPSGELVVVSARAAALNYEPLPEDEEIVS